ncbi:hypothetical protein TSUD_285560 [Trifolium subterraneum]|uniref:BED-type domain-containing protein n=1 Tax=Trifolium subterraneum TaxID=3900 RepID=A0A2Z6P688_TRISU|nr:hypothetical protein TSUD_285560 [Trifolium subterraneum]
MSSKASNPSPNGSFSGNDDSKIEISKDSADEIWKYGISLDGEDAIQCKFCDDVITGGLYRFLCHLAGTEHGGEGCGGGGDDDDDEEEEEKGCTCVGTKKERTTVVECKGNDAAWFHSI